MGVKLRRAFLDAGLASPTMRMRAVIGDAETAAEWLRAVAELTIVLAPTMEREGVATAADIGIDTLVDRLIQDVAKSRSSLSAAPRSAPGRASSGRSADSLSSIRQALQLRAVGAGCPGLAPRSAGHKGGRYVFQIHRDPGRSGDRHGAGACARRRHDCHRPVRRPSAA